MTTLALKGSIYSVAGDADGWLHVLDTAAVEALRVMRSKEERLRAACAMALGSIARSTGVVVRYQDDVVENLRVDVERNDNTVVGVTVVATIELPSRVIAVQAPAEPEAITIVYRAASWRFWTYTTGRASRRRRMTRSSCT